MAWGANCGGFARIKSFLEKTLRLPRGALGRGLGVWPRAIRSLPGRSAKRRHRAAGYCWLGVVAGGGSHPHPAPLPQWRGWQSGVPAGQLTTGRGSLPRGRGRRRRDRVGASRRSGALARGKSFLEKTLRLRRGAFWRGLGRARARGADAGWPRRGEGEAPGRRATAGTTARAGVPGQARHEREGAQRERRQAWHERGRRRREWVEARGGWRRAQQDRAQTQQGRDQMQEASEQWQQT